MKTENVLRSNYAGLQFCPRLSNSVRRLIPLATIHEHYWLTSHDLLIEILEFTSNNLDTRSIRS